MPLYKVYVSNIGCVSNNYSKQEAIRSYEHYAYKSKIEYGKISRETVSLFEDDELIAEYGYPLYLYTLEELEDRLGEYSEEVQKAISQVTETACPEWDDAIIEQWKEKLEKYGFDSPEIFYSGFWSQGDGAYFTTAFGNFSEILEAMQDTVEFSWNQQQAYPFRDSLSAYVDITVCTSGRYYTPQVSMSYNGLKYTGETFEGMLQEFAEDIKQFVLELCSEIYQDLEKEYEYLNSYEGNKHRDDKFDFQGNLQE